MLDPHWSRAIRDFITYERYRRFVPLGVERCHFCAGRVAAVWAVLERETAERLAVCDRHKYTAFS